jgi:hypothetical protein
MNRAETGVMQFEDDWPGVFIRGDEALGYSLSLRQIIEHQCKIHGDCGMAAQWLKLSQLQELLASCNARNNPQTQAARLGTPEARKHAKRNRTRREPAPPA